ncbi:MAG TPA: YceI family protein, partial [Thermoanaerobaculia bacterium]|nr:YceI family protein [Thermoanaerobaculia bacterium]
MRRRLALGILCIASAAALRAADTYTIDKAHSDVSFTIRHFASKVHGRFADFEGSIQAD